MKYQQYPVYKDSDLEWIGEIPIYWNCYTLKQIVAIPITDGPHVTPEFVDEGVPFISAEAVKNSRLDFSRKRGFIDSATHDEFARKCQPKRDDILMVKAGNTTGAVAWVETDEVFDIWSPLALVRANTEYVCSKYLFYFMNSPAFQTSILLASSYGTQPNIGMGVIERQPVVVPPLSEQLAIAAFLDRETAKIDALIARLERLQGLLQEKRQALIAHAVTKGVDPDAPLKASGVEWLGEVPAHWEVKRLKHLADIQTGVAKGRDLSGRYTIEVPYLRVANVQDGYLDLTDIATLEIDPAELERYALQVGDVLMNEGGDSDKLGRGHVWRGEIDPCIHQNHVFAVRPHAIDSEWLSLVTSAQYAKFFFFSFAKQSTNLASISSSNLRELPVPCPPSEERCAIRGVLEHRTAQIDALAEKAIATVATLRERRAALISAAVTGKIDVRGLA